ncbi:ABC transporter permease [Bordetella bronchialis]|uniref:Polyamine ABC transporter permease n=1 Tax=Bordetella bronchialis TaxID=463025 RepID=A0ABM6CTC6_9BORD|nr:ABC transporter permease [Bordetella bronchialis]ANN67309.1 polyamine ABC transporter permease [Bordetella bronchialis]
MTRSLRTPAALLCVPLALFAAFFVAPLCVVALASIFDPARGGFTLAYYVNVLADAYHWDVIATTFRIGVGSTLVCLLLGYPLAWYLVRLVRWRHWRRICVIILVVPLFTSNIVRSFGWMVMLGRNGIVNDAMQGVGLIDRPMRFLGTELGILIGMVYILLPFVVLAVGNTLARIDPGLEQASSDLGASPWQTFVHVTLPLTLPGVAAGAIMAFTLAVSAYVTPALLSGGRVTVLSVLIFQQYSSVFNVHQGGALSVVLLVLSLVLVALAGRVGQPARSSR